MGFEHEILTRLSAEGNLRRLVDVDAKGALILCDGVEYVNLSSNDYLGLRDRVDLQNAFIESVDRSRFLMSGSASRLMCGNSLEYSELEKYLADMYEAEDALVLGSGYLLNSSLLRAVCGEEDVILADKLIHASFVDGLQLCKSKWERWRHNDVAWLEKLLIKHSGKRVFVVIETLYSMDGDLAPMDQILELKKRYGFVLIADEAHAFGVFGSQGRGVIAVGEDVDYRVVTLGKAGASTGAFVICSSERKKLMVNKMKSLIYSTALPSINLLWSKFIIDQIRGMDSQREYLWKLIRFMGGESQIFPIFSQGNEAVMNLAKRLKEGGFWATPIKYPTVARGEERMRISLTGSLTIQQLEVLCRLIG